MPKLRHLYLIACIWGLPKPGIAQKKVGDLSIVYNSLISNARDSSKKITSTTGYFLKGNLSRSEVNSPMYSLVTIFDSKTGNGVLLKEVNGQKLLIRMDSENWNQKNHRFMNLTFKKTDQTKTIAGYFCSQAKASTPDGFEITVYYTNDLVPEDKAYDPTFKNLEGLPLEYEFTRGNLHIRYTLATINLTPVPASRFDVPTSGYRELTYEESLKMKANN